MLEAITKTVIMDELGGAILEELREKSSVSESHFRVIYQIKLDTAGIDFLEADFQKTMEEILKIYHNEQELLENLWK